MVDSKKVNKAFKNITSSNFEKIYYYTLGKVLVGAPKGRDFFNGRSLGHFNISEFFQLTNMLKSYNWKISDVSETGEYENIVILVLSK